jgi:hypothetical protein
LWYPEPAWIEQRGRWLARDLFRLTLTRTGAAGASKRRASMYTTVSGWS